MHSYTCDLRPSDGLSLEDDPRHIILAERSGTCTLILDSLSAQDSGQYACFAHSFMGSAGTLAKVVVQGKFTSSEVVIPKTFTTVFTLIMAAGLTAHDNPPQLLPDLCPDWRVLVSLKAKTSSFPLPRSLLLYPGSGKVATTKPVVV